VKGTCLCRRVTVEIARAPESITFCNCNFCRKLGAAWGYFDGGEVTVSGTVSSYSREDLDDVWLAGHFCPTCGTTTHYTFVEQHARDRIAVNTRVFAQAELDGIEARFEDGRAVTDDGDDFVRTGSGHIGDGKAF
jgi:hypothetical protein